MLLVLAIGAYVALHAGYAANSPLVFVAVLAGWLVSLCSHEFGHAYAAYLAGDHSPRTIGYLTFDPVKYIDPVMSVLLPAVFLAIGGMALPGGSVWLDIRHVTSRARLSIISASGPMANLIVLAGLAIIAAILVDENVQTEFEAALGALAFFQAMAIIINLIPIPGFDGWGVISPWLSEQAQEAGRRMSALSLMAIGVLVFVPGFGSALTRLSALVVMFLGFDVTYVAYGLERLSFWE